MQVVVAGTAKTEPRCPSPAAYTAWQSTPCLEPTRTAGRWQRNSRDSAPWQQKKGVIGWTLIASIGILTSNIGMYRLRDILLIETAVQSARMTISSLHCVVSACLVCRVTDYNYLLEAVLKCPSRSFHEMLCKASNILRA